MNQHAIQAEHPFKRSTQVQLRFNDIDALGHVNNSVYFQFFDLAKTEYFAGLEVNADINWCKPSIVIANVNCSFIEPTVFQEPVEVPVDEVVLINKVPLHCPTCGAMPSSPMRATSEASTSRPLLSVTPPAISVLK